MFLLVDFIDVPETTLIEGIVVAIVGFLIFFLSLFFFFFFF